MSESPFIEITHNSRTYRYQWDTITVEQSQLAQAVTEYKIDLQNHLPPTWDKFLQTGATDWLSTMIAYLIVPVTDGCPQPFTRAQVSNTLAWIQSLPATDGIVLEGIVTDFFTNIGKPANASRLLDAEFMSVRDMVPLVAALAPQLAAVLQIKAHANDSSMSDSDSSDSSSQGK